MQTAEAENIVISAAILDSTEESSPSRGQLSAAENYLTGKLGKDAFLKKCASHVLFARLIMAFESPTRDFTIDGLCALHRALYAGKEGAGDLRTTPLDRTGGSYADPRILRGSLKTVLTKLDRLPSAPEKSKSDFAALLAACERELIILAPFRYGNAVCRRAFMQALGLSHGFRLSFALTNKKELLAAEDAAFLSDDPEPLFTLLLKSLSYLAELPPRRMQDRKTPLLAKKPSKPAKKPKAEEKESKEKRLPEKPHKADPSLSQIRAELTALQASADALARQIDRLASLVDSLTKKE